MENNNIKKNFLNLVNACGTRDDLLRMIESNMNLLLDYVCAVFNMETQLPIFRFRLDGEDYRDAVMELDQRRRRAHNAAISAASPPRGMWSRCSTACSMRKTALSTATLSATSAWLLSTRL